MQENQTSIGKRLLKPFEIKAKSCPDMQNLQGLPVKIALASPVQIRKKAANRAQSRVIGQFHKSNARPPPWNRRTKSKMKFIMTHLIY